MEPGAGGPAGCFTSPNPRPANRSASITWKRGLPPATAPPTATRRRTGRESSALSGPVGRDEYSGGGRLNRAVAVALVRGPAAGMAGLCGRSKTPPSWRGYYFISRCSGYLELHQGNRERAEARFRRALGLTDMPSGAGVPGGGSVLRATGGSCQHVELLRSGFLGS